MDEIVHACPPPGSGRTPCCDLPPFELPRTDRLTVDPTLVTCPERRGRVVAIATEDIPAGASVVLEIDQRRATVHH